MKEEEEPRPQRGELLVRVHAVSLNFRDIAMVRGRYPQPFRKGLIPTSDAAGEVVETGESVDAFKIGDRVMGTFHARWFGGQIPSTLMTTEGYGSLKDGWLVERKVVSQEAVVRVPDNLSYEEAATLPCAGLTAWTALSGSTPIRAGHTVLTQGTGGVSIFALQLAKVAGASVIATTSSASKQERLRALGADEVVNYKEEPHWGERVRALTGGRGVDRVVEVGGPRDNRAVPPCRPVRRGDRLHRLSVHGKSWHRFLHVETQRSHFPQHFGWGSRRSAGCRAHRCHGWSEASNRPRLRL
jgi:NADPH:quinone reductase-like Zn-dependent oxidoreductase